MWKLWCVGRSVRPVMLWLPWDPQCNCQQLLLSLRRRGPECMSPCHQPAAACCAGVSSHHCCGTLQHIERCSTAGHFQASIACPGTAPRQQANQSMPPSMQGSSGMLPLQEHDDTAQTPGRMMWCTRI